MSSLRPGSLEAKLLYKSKSVDEWQKYLQNYHQTILYLTKHKQSANDLSSLDKFLWKTYIETIQSRQPEPYLTVEELTMIMKWKLTRGKFRPLLKLVESNQSNHVIAISKNAFKQLFRGDNWEKAVNTIIKLKGIGVATASAIFAPLKPNVIPFMADEVIESVCNCKRDYTLKIYKVMRIECINKAKELGNDWTAEDVSKALWVKAMSILYPNLKLDTTIIIDPDVPKDNKVIDTIVSNVKNSKENSKTSIANDVRIKRSGDDIAISTTNTKRTKRK